ncbi:MAG: phosphodiester glycosidase family protein [Gemmatimonadaceae bacterium]|jgi:hypothetical protein|nr:phosphodiester glycosidase family protein [Gemmatimonadaceae bacterium]
MSSIVGAQSRTPLQAAPCAAPLSAPVARVTWRDSTASMRWGTWAVRVGSPAVPVRLVVVALDPRAFHWALDVQRINGALEPWRLGAVGDTVAVALNVGHFTDDGPWGWLVHGRRERQAPGTGPLAGAVTVHADGAVRLHDAPALDRLRGDPTIVEAFQSYPTVLDASGRVPAALCAARDGVDPAHRDIRFAIATRQDGWLLLVLSRLDTDVPLADRTPVGPTTREMATALRALGATRAVLLDGGLSAQLLVRTEARTMRWPGLRVVPLGLVLVPRARVSPR